MYHINDPHSYYFQCTHDSQEFCKIYHQFFPFGDTNKFASYIFNCFDVNKDGLVEFREFVRALSVTSRGTMEEKLECKSLHKVTVGANALWAHDQSALKLMVDVVVVFIESWKF